MQAFEHDLHMRVNQMMRVPSPAPSEANFPIRAAASAAQSCPPSPRVPRLSTPCPDWQPDGHLRCRT